MFPYHHHHVVISLDVVVVIAVRVAVLVTIGSRAAEEAFQKRLVHADGSGGGRRVLPILCT